MELIAAWLRPGEAADAAAPIAADAELLDKAAGGDPRATPCPHHPNHAIIARGAKRLDCSTRLSLKECFFWEAVR